MGRTREFDADEVLDKAVQMFWEKGYEATSMAELEAGLGINKFSIYNTFGNKRALYQAALIRYEEMMTRSFVESLTEGAQGMQAIMQCFDSLEQHLQQPQTHYGCLVMNSGTEMSPRDPEIIATVKSNIGQMGDAFYHALAEAQKNGEISNNANLQDFARFLAVTYIGMVTVAKGEQDIRTVQSSIRFIKHMLQTCYES
jgi:TetR/AcrR family transcriptional repressor of nem operon